MDGIQGWRNERKLKINNGHKIKVNSALLKFGRQTKDIFQRWRKKEQSCYDNKIEDGHSEKENYRQQWDN